MRSGSIGLSIILTLVLMTSYSCSGLQSPTEPTGVNNIPWSPYILVHANGEVMMGYREAFSDLKNHGALRGIRINSVDRNGGSKPIVDLAVSSGLEIVGIFDNDDLFDDNVEASIDQIFRIYYPEITVFQFGNELTTIIPKTQPQMNIETYMLKLKRIYKHLRTNYPDVVLVTQSTFGSGFYGANELKRMAELGLKDMSPQFVILGMNIYTESALDEIAAIRRNHLGEYRVWVMESGTNVPDNQVSYVVNFYPRIRSELAAERIYWYALWAGDEGSQDTGFNLIGHPQTSQITMSPLYKYLTGR